MLKRVLALFLAAVIAASGMCVTAYADNSLDKSYDRKMKQLTALLDWDVTVKNAAQAQKYAVAFMSVSDGKRQAVTVYASSKSLSASLDKALEKAKATGITPKWLKLDIVTEVKEVSYRDFQDLCKGKLGGSFRQGVAFNDYFGRALLEAQLNSSGFLSYESGKLNLKAINTYFKNNRKKLLDRIPDTLYLFKTKGYFTDGTAYRLTDGTQNSKGRRDYTTDRKGLEALAAKTSSYFRSISGKDGKFVYGYYPIDNSEIDEYNIIRHGGTTWNLILQYDMTKDKRLVPVIEKALDFLVERMIYKDKETGFIDGGNCFNVGANGISLLAFTTYAEIFGSDKYNKVIKELANGVVMMQKESGGFTHTMRTDGTVYRDFVVIFYDGEAMFGLLKAYGVLKDKKYLTAAEKSADYFIANNYEKENSHWISYAFNELTKYSPKTEYFAFGLRNIGDGYLNKVKDRTYTAAHTRAETLGAAFELYDRLISSGKTCPELASFDKDLLISAMEARIDYGLNYFMFPEYAMYFVNPKIVLDSFAIREDLFRIRIDDIQHFMGGYYLYWKNYDKIMSYKNS